MRKPNATIQRLAALGTCTAACAFLAAVALPAPALAADHEYEAETDEGTYTFYADELSDGTLRITQLNFDNAVTTVTLPARIDSKKVTVLGADVLGEWNVRYGGHGGASQLKIVNLPSTLKTIESNHETYDMAGLNEDGCNSVALAFSTQLAAINVDTGNTAYKSIDGVLFNKAGTKLIAYPGGKSGSAYTVPASVKTVSKGAFYKAKIKTVTLGKNVSSVDKKAFYRSSSLKTLKVASGNKQLSAKGGVLFNKKRTKLLKFPNAKTGSYAVPAGVTSIGERAFQETAVEKVALPTSMRTIGKAAFFNAALTSVKLNKGLRTISTAAFYRTKLAKVSIPASVTKIAAKTTLSSKGASVADFVDYAVAFADCSKLKSISVASGNTHFSSKSGVLFDKGKKTLVCYPLAKAGKSYTVPSSVKTLGVTAFAFQTNSGKLKTIKLPSGLKTIKQCCFLNYYTPEWPSMNVPAGTETQYAFAFLGRG